MKWSLEQDNALTAVEQWRKAGDSQVFRLFGYAGAGKTTLLQLLGGPPVGQILEDSNRFVDAVERDDEVKETAVV